MICAFAIHYKKPVRDCSPVLHLMKHLDLGHWLLYQSSANAETSSLNQYNICSHVKTGTTADISKQYISVEPWNFY